MLSRPTPTVYRADPAHHTPTLAHVEASYRRGAQQCADALADLVEDCVSLEQARLLLCAAVNVLGELRAARMPCGDLFGEMKRRLCEEVRR